MRTVTIEEKAVAHLKLTITPSRAVVKFNPAIHSKEQLEAWMEFARNELVVYDMAKYQYTVRCKWRKDQIDWDHRSLPEYRSPGYENFVHYSDHQIA